MSERSKGRLLSVDDSGMTATFVLTTDTVDRDGETVDPAGGDFSDYDRNPVVAFNHDTDDFPIGRCVRLWNEEVGGRLALLGKVQFSKVNPKGRLAYEMTREGTLGAASISFVPTGPVQRNRSGGNHYGNWKLLEFSICPVGSNPDAIKLRLKSAKGGSRGAVSEDEFGEAIKAICRHLQKIAADDSLLASQRYEIGQLREKWMDDFGLLDEEDEAEIEEAIGELRERTKSLSDTLYWATGRRV